MAGRDESHRLTYPRNLGPLTVFGISQLVQAVELGLPLAIGIFLVGAFFITAKNVANRERARVRRTDGHTTVWGKPSARGEVPEEVRRILGSVQSARAVEGGSRNLLS